MSKTKKLALAAILAASALVLSYLELLLPPLYPAIPGIKMGLANIAVLYALYSCGAGIAAAVSLVRLLLSALLFGTPISLLYGLLGAALSLAVMCILKKTDRFSCIGVSIAGGVFHNLGQILLAAVIMKTAEIGYYFPILAITGTVAGALVGACGALLIKKTVKAR